MLKNKILLHLLLLFLIAISTRFLWLGNLPYGLHADEASFLINTYSIVETGADEDGRAFPLWLNSYLDPKPALYSYLQAPFVMMLGPSTVASRIPAAVLGVVSLGLIYWLAQFFFKKQHALIISTLAVLSPWHIVVSRSTQEVILAFVFSLLAISLFLKLRKNSGSKLFLILSIIVSSGLAFYSYHSAKIFLPLLFIGWISADWIFSDNKKQILKKVQPLLVATLGSIAILIVLTLLAPSSLERFNAIGLFSEAEPQLIAEEQIRTATGSTPHLLIRFFYNKLVTYKLAAIELYTQHFSIEYLFLSGGEPKRYLVPFHGLLYLIEIVLLPLGIFIGLHQPKQRKTVIYFVWWLLVAPIPAALTSQEIPSIIRNFMMVVPLMVFISIALVWLWQHKSNVFGKATLGIVAAGYLWGFAYFAQQFGVQQANYHPWYRNRGEEQLASYLLNVQDDYDVIDVATIRDLYVYLTLQDPSLLTELQSLSHQEKLDNFKLGNFLFNSRGCELTVYPETVRALQVLPTGCEVPEGYSIVEVIRYDDLAEVYQVIE